MQFLPHLEHHTLVEPISPNVIEQFKKNFTLPTHSCFSSLQKPYHHIQSFQIATTIMSINSSCKIATQATQKDGHRLLVWELCIHFLLRPNPIKAFSLGQCSPFIGVIMAITMCLLVSFTYCILKNKHTCIHPS